MLREEAIENFKEFIDHFQTQIKQAQAISDKAFDVERAERDIQTFDMAIQALSQEPTSEKELNKAYTFGHNKGVKAYYNEQLCTVELPEAVFRYILSLVPTEEAEQEPCDDAISREAVDKYIARLLSGYLYDGERERLEIFSAYLWELPSVTQKSGKWLLNKEKSHFFDVYECSNCAKISGLTNYCPNCGAKMESEG